jgi:hypothetical protein
MADPTKQSLFHDEPFAELYANPMDVRLKGTFSSAGAVCTMSSTRRQSCPGVTITGATGSYAVAGLPLGTDVSVLGCELKPPTGTQLVCIANLLAGTPSASLGTATLKTRRSDTGAEAAPADGTEIEITLRYETGAS